MMAKEIVFNNALLNYNATCITSKIIDENCMGKMLDADWLILFLITEPKGHFFNA